MFKKEKTGNLLDQYKKKEINLLPDLYFKKKRQVRSIIFVACIVAVCVSVFLYNLFEMYSELELVKAQNIKTIEAIEEKDEEQRRQTLLTALKKRIEFKVNLLKEIEAENTSVLLVADVIESSLPEGVLYVNVDFTSTESMTVYGRTDNQNEIPDLIHKLREQNIFKKVNVETITKIESEYYAGTETYYEFTLICSFGGVQNAPNE